MTYKISSVTNLAVSSGERMKNPDINIVMHKELTNNEISLSSTKTKFKTLHSERAIRHYVLDGGRVWRHKWNRNNPRRERRVRTATTAWRMTVYLAVDKTLKKPIASFVYGYVRAERRGNGWRTIWTVIINAIDYRDSFYLFTTRARAELPTAENRSTGLRIYNCDGISRFRKLKRPYL